MYVATVHGPPQKPMKNRMEPKGIDKKGLEKEKNLALLLILSDLRSLAAFAPFLQ